MGLMDTIKGWFSKGKEMAGDVADKAGATAEGAWDKTAGVREKAGDMAEGAMEKAKDVVEDIKDKFDGDDDEAPAAGE